MSVKQPPKIRKAYILTNRPLKSIKQIADAMGVNTRTIDRDVEHLKEKGLYQQVFEHELWRLHREGEVSDETKYREVAKLFGKGIVDKHQIEASGAVTYIIKKWSIHDDDRERDTS